MIWRSIFMVAAGGALGSVARYLLGSFVNQKFHPTHWPWGTFLVNLIGCFLIGLLGGWWTKTPVAMEWRLVLITGFLGGFTTFSAFALESLELFQTRPTLMIAYAVSSTILGITLAAIAFWLGSR